MRKQLYLIRHGKSDWGNSQLSDFDRPLNPRGHSAAPEMAERILRKGLVPDLVLSSPALRAITTAWHFCKVWQKPATQIQEITSIYEANIKALLKIVNGLNNAHERVTLFGHNPGFTDFANYLSDAKIYNIPTCGVVLIEFDTASWAEITQFSGKLVEFDFPKNTDSD